MFNAEQAEHMRDLAAIPPSERCWCGWGRAGACDTPNPCPPESGTLADALATACPCCGCRAERPDHPPTTVFHRAGCTRERRAEEIAALDLGEAGA